MFVSRRRDFGMSMNTSELFEKALGSAIKTSFCENVPVLIMLEDSHLDPGMYVERESDVRLSHERRRVYARVVGWEIEWLS